jgi:23S rRNA U2552 (ribose-2'-O)-methylase RlmE/FtsJ
MKGLTGEINNERALEYFGKALSLNDKSICANYYTGKLYYPNSIEENEKEINGVKKSYSRAKIFLKNIEGKTTQVNYLLNKIRSALGEPVVEYRSHFDDDFTEEENIKESPPEEGSTSSSEYTMPGGGDKPEEKTESFKISSVILSEFKTFPTPVYGSKRNPNFMKNAKIIDTNLVENLWIQKSRMDKIYDNAGKKFILNKIRDEIFPYSVSGSTKYRNRAGNKLETVVNSINLLDGIVNKNFVFLDCCGGPGAFTDYIFKNFKNNCIKGYGISLKTDDRKLKWYSELTTDPKFQITYGNDGTGDVYNFNNLQSVFDLIKKDGHLDNMSIFVSDGGIEASIENGVHMDNYQELYSSRIILSEIVLMLMTLKVGGVFVCKIFDTFSLNSLSLLYIVSQLFEETFIVKPIESRIVNSEKYLVGKKLKMKDEKFKSIRNFLIDCHKNWSVKDNQQDVTIVSFIPEDVMYKDQTFMNSIKEYNKKLCATQIEAIKIMMDRIDHVLSNVTEFNRYQKEENAEKAEREKRGGRGRGR